MQKILKQNDKNSKRKQLIKQRAIPCSGCREFNTIDAMLLLSQSCRTLCNPIDGSLPGSSVHGIFQARVLEWVAIAFSNSYNKSL